MSDNVTGRTLCLLGQHHFVDSICERCSEPEPKRGLDTAGEAIAVLKAAWKGLSEPEREEFRRKLRKDSLAAESADESEEGLDLRDDWEWLVEECARLRAGNAEMLEALRGMVRSHGMHGPCESNGCTECRRAHAAARTVIARATA